ncbi:MAG: response regulator transcription factor [Bacteroidota bacterium]
MKVLIIEDEKALACSIGEYLEHEGFLCELAHNLHEGIEKTDLYAYDCILVDITLPGGNGLEIIRALKNTKSKTGIIITSAKNSLEDKIQGLDLGADDYITKPFHLSELNARIKALLRRKRFGGEARIDYQEISVDTDTQEATVNGKVLKLTRSEYRLLLYFLASRTRVLSKESIAEHLVGNDADLLDNFDFIYSHIKNLRKKMLKAGGGDYIKAVYGMGYKFANN